ncbi:MAG: AzlD domain-containing protein [Desulfobacteraceae bacterium]|nr:AzlD domain-containing protein [Desulfobacteraceae bacterium]
MTNDTQAIITILGMALVTYVTRILGFYISDKITRMPPKLEQALKYIPGTIIISIIAPQIVSGGSVTVTASIICTAAALLFRNLVAVMVTGVVYVSILRNLIFI